MHPTALRELPEPPNVAMPDSGLPRRSPRHSGGGAGAGDGFTDNVPSPVATPVRKPASGSGSGLTPTNEALKENGANATASTPSSILKRRRRSILSEVSKVADGKQSPAGGPGGALDLEARKKRKQSLASRRVSFAVESALESVREFQKDERDADKAFPDPRAAAVTATTAVSVPVPGGKPPTASATLVTCPPPAAPVIAMASAHPPPSPFGAGPASAAAEAAFAAFSPATTPQPAKTAMHELRMATPSSAQAKTPRRGPGTDPFAAFGVSDSPAPEGGTEYGANLTGAQSGLETPRSAVFTRGLHRVSNASDFIPLGTPVSMAPSSAAPSSAGGGDGSVGDGTPGSMFTNHLPRRVTMDPGQYRDAMKAASLETARDGTDDVIHEETEGTDTESDLSDAEFAPSQNDGITAAVPGLSALADEDEDDFGEEPGTHTMNLVNGLNEPLFDLPGQGDTQEMETDEGEPMTDFAGGDITSAVPGLSALADEDDAFDAQTPGGVSYTPGDTYTPASYTFSSAEKSPAIGGLPMGSVTEDVASMLASKLAASVAADNAQANSLKFPETTEEFAFSAALVSSDEAGHENHGKGGRKSHAKKRRMTLGVRHELESPAAVVDAQMTDTGVAEAEAAAVGGVDTGVDEAAMAMNLSDSFDVPPGAGEAADVSFDLPPGAAEAAESIFSDGLTTRVGGVSDGIDAPSNDVDAMDPVTQERRSDSGSFGGAHTFAEADVANTAHMRPSAKSSSRSGFSEPGTDTMRLLSKMKDDTYGGGGGGSDGYPVSVSDPVGKFGGDTTNTDDGFVLNPPDGAGDTTNTWGKEHTGVPVANSTVTMTGLSAFKHMPLRTPSTHNAGNGNASVSPYSSEGTVTPANAPPTATAGEAPASEGDGFTPGPDTLLMMEKLKGRKHGDANFLESSKKNLLGGRASLGLSAHAWIAPTPLPPIGGGFGVNFTPNKTHTIAGGGFGGNLFASVGRGTSFGGGGLYGQTVGAPTSGRKAFGEDSTNAVSPFAPGASQRAALQSAKSKSDQMALGLLGLPLGTAPIPAELMRADAPKVLLGDFFHACEVSFMDAKNLRRKSVAMVSLCTAAAPATFRDALKLVCLTAPMIECMDPMHDELNSALSSLARDAERLRREVEVAQPPLLRLPASHDGQHIAVLREAGKLLKKQCQLTTKEHHAVARLQTEQHVSNSLCAAKTALTNVRRSLAQSVEIATEASHCADVREVDLRRRFQLTGDAESRDAQRLRTREGALVALAERRSRVAKLRQELTLRNVAIETAQRERGECEASIARASDLLHDAKQAAEAKGDSDVLVDGGAARRAASVKRVKQLQMKAKKSCDELAVLNKIAPWRVERVNANTGSGAELVLKVGALFRVAVDIGTGAGRVTLCVPETQTVTPAGGASFAAAVAGVPKAWSETDCESFGGDVAAVLQNLVPTLTRAESILEEAETCRAAFPRITRMRCTSGGDLELTFCDLATERKVEVALTMANGAYPRGALRPRVFIKHHGRVSGGGKDSSNNSIARLPSATTLEAAIERVPAGEASRRLLGVCRLIDWIVAFGERGMGDAAREAAAASRPPPPRDAPNSFFQGVTNAKLPSVAKKGVSDDWGGEDVVGDAEVEVPAGTSVETETGNQPGVRAEVPDRVSEHNSTTVSGREPVTVHVTEKFGDASPSVSVPPTTPGSEWGEEHTENVVPAEFGVDVEKTTRVSPRAETPAGFQKGSNPLFDDSDEEMEDAR